MCARNELLVERGGRDRAELGGLNAAVGMLAWLSVCLQVKLTLLVSKDGPVWFITSWMLHMICYSSYSPAIAMRVWVVADFDDTTSCRDCGHSQLHVD